MDWVAVALEEYRTLREEALDALREQITVQRFGLAGLGVLLGIGIQARSDIAVAATVLLGLTPLAAVFLLVMWMVAYGRMATIGMQLARLEAEISDRFPAEPWPLTWERSRYPGALNRVLTRPRTVLILFVALG